MASSLVVKLKIWEIGNFGFKSLYASLCLCSWFSVGHIIHDVYTAAHPEDNNVSIWFVTYSQVVKQYSYGEVECCK